MSWSQGFSGKISDVKEAISKFNVNFSHKSERLMFDRAKSALLVEVSVDEHHEYSTGFIVVNFSGYTYENYDDEQNNYSSMNFCVSVERMKIPVIENIENV